MLLQLSHSPPPFFNDTATTEIYTDISSSAASDVYKRQLPGATTLGLLLGGRGLPSPQLPPAHPLSEPDWADILTI